MMANYPDELACDMAETYGVFDVKRVPLQMLATLAVGLRDDSRVKRAKSKITVPDEIVLLACILDALRGVTDPHSPKSALGFFLKGATPEQEDHETFDSPDSFWEWANSITEEQNV